MLLLYPSKEEAFKIYYRNWRKNNSDKAKAICKKYRDAHPDKKKASNDKWLMINKDKAKEKNKQWRKSHPQNQREATKLYASKHPDKIKALHAKHYAKIKACRVVRIKNKQTKEEHIKYKHNWYEQNKLELSKKAKKRRETHKDELKEKKRIYYRTHKQELAEKNKKWMKTPKGKAYSNSIRDARKRELGNEFLNTWFIGCEKHHINKQQIVCIPAELHRKYRHNHKKPDTMIEINRIAMQYLFNCKA